MKNFFSVIVIFAVLIVGGGYVFMKDSAKKNQERVVEDLSSARRTFAQKARAAATLEDTDAYLRAMRASLESYKEELKKRVYRDSDELRDPEGYKKLVEAKFKKGELDEAKRKSMIDGYDIVKDAYDTMMAGNWK